MNGGAAVFAISFSAGMAFAQTDGQKALDRGAALYRDGRFEEAARAFAEAAALDPGSLEVWESLGWAQRKAGRPDDARAVWARILKVDPARASLWNEMAAIDIEREDWATAADSLVESLRLEPDESRVRLRLAMVLEKAGRFDEATRAYQELARRDPEDLTATLRLASFHERRGEIRRALEALSEASRRIPRFAHIFEIHRARLEARLADFAYSAGDFHRAIEGYRDAVESNPRDAGYLENLGWAHRRAGDLEEAVKVWQRARVRAPEDALLARHLADALLESGERDEAKTLYLEAWSTAPGTDDAVPYRLAEIALEEARLEEASEWIEALFQSKGADEIWSARIAGLFARAEEPLPGIRIFRARREVSSAPRETAAAEGRLQALAGRHARVAADYEAAVDHYREALRLDPENRSALRDFGWLQWVMADWEGCRASWNRLSALDPAEVDALNLLTHLHLYRGSYADAIATASRSLALVPDQPEQSLKLARALHGSERYAEAKALAERLAQSRPGDLDIQRFWAELLMQYHDFERGLPVWQRVLALGASDPRAHFYYVKSLYELGHYDAALAEGRRFAQAEEAHPGLLRLLADDALVRDEKAEAGGWLLRLAERSPGKADLWLDVANLQLEMGSEVQALATIDRALRYPGEAGERRELERARANLLRRRGFREEAYSVYRDLAAENPESREDFWGRIQTASETGRYQEALSILEGNRGTFLKAYEVELERARLLQASGHGDEAREALQRAAERSRTSFVVPILLYHGLGGHPRTPVMPLARFESQIQSLSEAGYEAITVSELDRMARGVLPRPRRPILITFDDARIDSFELADPVLEKHGMKATMFVPTGLTLDGHPFFADWTRMTRFAATGRWDFQAHGHRAHDLIATSWEGTEGSFLVNRMWLTAEARLETEGEYLARLEDDYRRARREIESRIPGAEVSGYAFPFSEAGQENRGNYPEASEANERFLSDTYRLGFIQDANGWNEIGSSSTPFLKRYSVPRHFDGGELLRHLAREHPRARALSELARYEMWAGLYARSRRSFQTLVREYPVLADEAAFYLASIDYQQGGLRAARQHLEAAKRAEQSVRVEELSRLERRIAWDESFRIEPRFTLFQDSATRLNRAQGLGFTLGAFAPVELRGSFGTVSFEEEGFTPFEALEGEGELSVRATRHLRLEGRVRQRNDTNDGRDSTNYWGVIGLEGERAELFLRGGEEDVDTLRARIEGIVLRSFQVQHLFRMTPRIWTQLDARYGEYSDSNRAESLTGRISFRPGRASPFRLGAAFGFLDHRIQSQAYYTPEELRFGRGLLSYAKGSPSGWSTDASVELGWAQESLRGSRFTAYARGRMVQAWSHRVRSSISWTFGSSPGYRSWSVLVGLHYGFTDAGSGTAQ